MILGTGIDIVNIERIAKLFEQFGDNFGKKIFTEKEISIAQKKKNAQIKMSYFAKRFAAKEAFSKAIGLGIGKGVSFLDIEIINDTNGKPFINLSGGAKNFSQKHLQQNNFKIDLSMSDTQEIAQAMVIISTKNR